MHFGFCHFDVGERRKRKMKNMEKEHFKKQKYSVFWVAVNEDKVFFAKWHLLEKSATRFVFGG